MWWEAHKSYTTLALEEVEVQGQQSGVGDTGITIQV